MMWNCYFAVSKVCNLRCRYCYVPEYNKRDQAGYDGRALQSAERFAKKIASEKPSIGNIALHGAEPTIVSAKTLGKIINLFNQATNHSVGVQSNGTRLTSEYLDALIQVIKNPKKFSVGISMDGSPNIHNPQRNNTWELVHQNILELKKRNFQVALLAVITPLTLEHLDDFANWVTSMRSVVDTVTFKLGEHGFGLSEDGHLAFADWLYESKNIKSLQAFMPDLCMSDGNACEFYEFDLNGNCYSCNKNYMDSGVFANWFTESFETIVRKRKRLYRNTPLDPECRTCLYKPLCHGGCPLSRENDKSVDCRIKKRIYSRLFEDGFPADRFFFVEDLSTYFSVLQSAMPLFFSQRASEAEKIAYDFVRARLRPKASYQEIVCDFFHYLNEIDFEEQKSLLFINLADYEYFQFVLRSKSGREPMPKIKGRESSEGAKGLLSKARVKFSPHLFLKKYDYAVHRIREESDLKDFPPQTTNLLLYKNAGNRGVRVLSLSSAKAKFLEVFQPGAEITVEEGLKRFIAQHPRRSLPINDAVAFLEELNERGALSFLY